jgi:hypothetical protein
LFEKDGLQGAIHSLGPYFFSLPVVFLIYKFVGLSVEGWVAVSLLLHIVNAFLVYLFARKVAHSLLGKASLLPTFFSGIIFLISPYQTEAVLWNPANMGFLMATALSLLCLLFFADYLTHLKKPNLYFFHFTFLSAVYSWESAFILPGVSLLLYFLYYSRHKTNLQRKDFIFKIFLPQIGIILSYLLITKVLFGSWLWHSGSFDVSFSFILLAGTALKYLAKFFLFYRYLPLNSGDDVLRQAFSHHGIVLLAFILLSLVLTAGCRLLIKNKNNKGQFLLILFLCFMVALFPVLPLDSSFLKFIYPDRYGYFPSVFYYIFITHALFFLLKKFSLPVLIGYSILCGVLLTQTITVWNSANDYCSRLTENYRPFLNYERVFILNVPAYYKGLAAFRSAFAETIYMKYGNSSTDKIRIISGCYQESADDSLVSVSMSANTVHVSGFKKRTPYFSTNGGWAVSYETNEYSVKYDPTGCSYMLSFKQEIPKNSAFIYTVNGIWKKAD